MSKKKLIERWNSVQNKKEVFLNDLSTKNAVVLENLPFGFTEEGKCDLRGIHLKGFDEHSSNNRMGLINVVFDNCDLSFSDFEDLSLEQCRFTNCSIVSANWENVLEFENQFVNCNFQKVDFRHAFIGNRNSKYDACTFDSCNFQRCYFYSPQYLNVAFNNCNLKHFDFNGASFENCSFEGSMNNVTFRGKCPESKSETSVYKKNEMKQVSFENLDFHDLDFSNDCRLDDLKIKQDPKYLLVKDLKVKITQLYKTRDKYSLNTKIFIEVFHGIAIDRDQNSYLFNVEDWTGSIYDSSEMKKVFQLLGK